MAVAVETYRPAYSDNEFLVDTEPDLRRLFDYLASIESGAASFGPAPNPGDHADVILGVSRGHYTVTRLHGGQAHQLIGEAGAEGDIELDLGGQETSIPRRWLLSEEGAFQALLGYVLTGAFPADLQWDR